MEPDHFMQSYFLDKEYAITIPLALLLGVVVFVASFVSYVLITTKKKKTA